MGRNDSKILEALYDSMEEEESETVIPGFPAEIAADNRRTRPWFLFNTYLGHNAQDIEYIQRKLANPPFNKLNAEYGTKYGERAKIFINNLFTATYEDDLVGMGLSEEIFKQLQVLQGYTSSIEWKDSDHEVPNVIGVDYIMRHASIAGRSNDGTPIGDLFYEDILRNKQNTLARYISYIGEFLFNEQISIIDIFAKIAALHVLNAQFSKSRKVQITQPEYSKFSSFRDAVISQFRNKLQPKQGNIQPLNIQAGDIIKDTTTNKLWFCIARSSFNDVICTDAELLTRANFQQYYNGVLLSAGAEAFNIRIDDITSLGFHQNTAIYKKFDAKYIHSYERVFNALVSYFYNSRNLATYMTYDQDEEDISFTLKPGAIIPYNWSFSETSGNKDRPVLVLSVRDNKALVAKLTTQVAQAGNTVPIYTQSVQYNPKYTGKMKPENGYAMAEQIRLIPITSDIEVLGMITTESILEDVFDKLINNIQQSWQDTKRKTPRRHGV